MYDKNSVGRCEACRWFIKKEHDDTWGICTRHPNHIVIGIARQMTGRDFCGEYAPDKEHEKVEWEYFDGLGRRLE